MSTRPPVSTSALSAVLLSAFLATTAASAADAPPGDWPNYGRTPGGDRHSPLKQLTRDNVSGLTLAWEYRTGEAGIETSAAPLLPGAPDATLVAFRTQASHFAAAIRGTVPALAPAEDGVRLMRMLDALYASASERREVGLGG